MEDLKIKDLTTDNFENSLNEESQLWSNSKSYAIATLDGTIMLVQDEVILWSMQVDHNISALYPLDVTGDGADEIIACTWDGQTYILDQERNSVRFQFEEPVRAFCAGSYSRDPGCNTPCLVYNNFYNKGHRYLQNDVSRDTLEKSHSRDARDRCRIYIFVTARDESTHRSPRK
ncbi:unnamed protein product [Trichogramma brassicae]|uniref:Uncharacterized protein n=1 Tax=Trichogramma brassicae TaxID=86971 RepID=A0A6H5I9U4_9HYME|nr:unnamed protein product [Trichogramma brassicae]